MGVAVDNSAINKMESPMLIKVLATSALVLGVATSAMAQSSDTYTWRHHRHYRPAIDEQIDPSTTGSIYSDSAASGLNSLGNPGPIGPCASDSTGPDANSGMNVNDQYCGK